MTVGDSNFAFQFMIDLKASLAAEAGVPMSSVFTRGISPAVTGGVLVEMELAFPPLTALDTVETFSGRMGSNLQEVLTGEMFSAVGLPVVDVYEPAVAVPPPPASPPPPGFTAKPSPPPAVVLEEVAELVYEEDYVEEEVIPDTIPPVVTLRGEAVTYVNQHTVYFDAGADALDDRDGYVDVFTRGLDRIDTTEPTDGDPFTIYYAALDNSNNLAEAVVRHVVIVNWCAPEKVCIETMYGDPIIPPVCSVNDLCFSSVSSEGEEDVVAEVEVDPDETPPVLTLLGDGELAKTKAGVVVMSEYIMVDTAWRDAGIIAMDDRDGDISHLVAKSGVGGVDSYTATGEDNPYIVTYDVSDAAGNQAETVRRRIYVIDPCEEAAAVTGYAEFLCGDGQCSEYGLCESITLKGEEEVIVNQPPTLELLGPAIVEVDQYRVYEKCLPDARIDVVCDKGVDANDPEEGNLVLAEMVWACSPDGELGKFSRKGLSYCGIDTDIPGEYTVTFTARDSAGLEAAPVSRTVKVIPSCPAGERLCSNKIDCSSGGLCASEIASGLSQAEDQEAEDLPPTMEFILDEEGLLSGFVPILWGRPLVRCAEGQLPRAEEMCDLGVIAMDDGVDISENVLVCPPSTCMDQLCPGHEFNKKDVGLCINTRRDVGTVITVDYVVYDSAMPPNIVTLTRSITIETPCEGGDYLCSDGTCSAVDCDARDRLAQLESVVVNEPPELTMLYDSPVRLTYQQPFTGSFLPCATAAQAESSPSSCAAFSVDAEEGDISAYIAIRETTPADAGLPACTADVITSGNCLPGTYTYTYAIADLEGGETSVDLVIEVVQIQSALVSIEVTIDATSTSQADADEEAQTYLDPTSEASIVYREQLAQILNSDPEIVVDEESISITTAIATLKSSASSSTTDSATDTATDPATDVEYYYDYDLPREFSIVLGVSLTVQTDPTFAARRRSLLSTNIADAVGDATGASADAQDTTPAVDADAATLAAIQSSTTYLSTSYDQNVVAMTDTKSTIQGVLDGGSGYDGFREALTLKLQDAVTAGTAEHDAAITLAEQAISIMNVIEVPEMAPISDGSAFTDLASMLSSELDDIQENAENLVDAFQDVYGGGAVPPPPPPPTVVCDRSGGGDVGILFEVPSTVVEAVIPAVETEEEYDGASPRERPQDGELRRFIGNNNRIIGGLVISQVRRQLVECSTLGTSCRGPEDTSSYGRDPVFVSTSSLYDRDVEDFKDLFYNTSSSAEVSALGFPYAFHTTPGYDNGFLVYIDIALTKSRALKLIQYLREANFFDAATDTVRVQVITYNGRQENGFFGNSVVDLEFTVAGEIKVTTDVRAVAVVSYSGIDGIFRLFAELLLTGMILVATYLEAMEFVTMCREEGFGLYDGLRFHFSSAWNIMDAINLVVQLMGQLMWWMNVLLVALEWECDLRYDVYDLENDARAHWFLSNREGVGADSGAAVAIEPLERAIFEPPGSHRWTLPENRTGVEKLQETIQNMDTQVSLLLFYFCLQGFSLSMMILRFFKYIQFHARLSMTSDTIGTAWPDLYHFALVFALVTICIMVPVHVIFGPYFDFLSELWPLTRRFFEDIVAGGNVAEVVSTDMEFSAIEYAASIFIYMGAPFILVFLMLNFILGIVGDAFGEVKEGLADSGPHTGVFTDLGNFAGEAYTSYVNGWNAAGIEELTLKLFNGFPELRTQEEIDAMDDEEEDVEPRMLALHEMDVLEEEQALSILQAGSVRAESEPAPGEPDREALVHFVFDELALNKEDLPEEAEEEEEEEEEEEGVLQIDPDIERMTKVSGSLTELALVAMSEHMSLMKQISRRHERSQGIIDVLTNAASSSRPNSAAAEAEDAAPAPAEEESAPAPAEEESAPAPAEEESAPAPAEEESAPAPAEEESAPAPAEEESAPAPSEEEK